MKKDKCLLEVCAVSLSSAKAALAGGAARVELCSALELGGLTPSAGIVRQVCAIPSLLTHVLVRPRSGDFCYNADEAQIIIRDIEQMSDWGVDGVVVGALREDGSLDVSLMKEIMKASRDMSVTFHRAFDVCAHPEVVMEQLIDMGVDRILTSGRKATAEEGISQICSFVAQAKDRISIMPGCGVTASNAHKIVSNTNVKEIHASAKRIVDGKMLYHNPDVLFGRNKEESDAHIETDEVRVRAIVDALRL